MVLITENHLQHTGDADAELVWPEVYRFLEGFATEKNSRPASDMLRQFLHFLKARGLSPAEPLSMEQIVSHFYARGLRASFSRLIHLVRRMDWQRVYEHVPDNKGSVCVCQPKD